ncbi:hypothetical protein [Massilia sp. AB1]|uniref:hypothetical protein n=1 Tax=Massilia sp. AB1 TaxID=2823371 RepID=UPI001B83A1DB|nr:hypothetical protein [Massilia sp. AB1]MBQ5938552.1 hypothetical protein [Massilia sp. AB1]
MNEFEKFAYNEICTALADIDSRIAPDNYVLSFFVFDADDDPRRPVLQLGYNTRTRVSESIPFASSAEEATWNFAFWLQNELRFIGEPGTKGGQLLEDVLAKKGLWYSDEDDEADFDRCTQVGEEITAYFVDACVRIAQALHASGVIERRFSRALPIIVHELEYYDEIARQTRLANPAGLTREFDDWIASLYRH